MKEKGKSKVWCPSNRNCPHLLQGTGLGPSEKVRYINWEDTARSQQAWRACFKHRCSRRGRRLPPRGTAGLSAGGKVQPAPPCSRGAGAGPAATTLPRRPRLHSLRTQHRDPTIWARGELRQRGAFAPPASSARLIPAPICRLSPRPLLALTPRPSGRG